MEAKAGARSAAIKSRRGDAHADVHGGFAEEPHQHCDCQQTAAMLSRNHPSRRMGGNYGEVPSLVAEDYRGKGCAGREGGSCVVKGDFANSHGESGVSAYSFRRLNSAKEVQFKDKIQTNAVNEAQCDSALYKMFAPGAIRMTLEFEAGVVDGQTNVAVGFGETAYGFHLIYIGLKHNYCDGNGLACGLDGANGGVAVDVAYLHEDADTTLDELRVLHVHVDHEVVVDVAETGHGASSDHVEDHLLGRGGLHARGARDDLGADLSDDGGVGDFAERCVEIAGDGGGFCSAGACVLDGTDDVGGAATGGDADNDVFAGGTAAGNIALA
jgi:hypothetical protein